MIIQENIFLKSLTTFRTGGPARYFSIVKNIDELQEAVEFAHNNLLQIFVLGGGSNILVGDAGFSGLVIKMEITGIECNEKDSEYTEVVAGAGENWDLFVEQAVAKNLSGIENLSFIPGTVGAAPVQNIGAYGVEAKDTLSWVEVFDTQTQEIKIFKNSECGFSYRDSIFKKEEGKKYIITRVAFLLTKYSESGTKKSVLNTSYKDITEYIKNNNLAEKDITLQKVRDIVIDIRKKKLPDVAEVGTAGSFFKNPIVAKEVYEELLKKYPEMPSFSAVATPPEFGRGLGGGVGELVKIPAAWLLDKICGFKGYRDGDVGVYHNQALVLVNFGSATSLQILNLAEHMISCVNEKTGIVLEKEVQII